VLVIVNLLNTEEIIDIAISFSLKHCFKRWNLVLLFLINYEKYVIFILIIIILNAEILVFPLNGGNN